MKKESKTVHGFDADGTLFIELIDNMISGVCPDEAKVKAKVSALTILENKLRYKRSMPFENNSAGNSGEEKFTPYQIFLKFKTYLNNQFDEIWKSKQAYLQAVPEEEFRNCCKALLIIICNPSIFKSIPEGGIAVIDSNRQDAYMELHKQERDAEELYPLMPHLAGLLGLKFDPILLADICNALPAGTAYNLYIKNKPSGTLSELNIEHPQAHIDHWKLLLQIAQAYYFKIQYPSFPIKKLFYDDSPADYLNPTDEQNKRLIEIREKNYDNSLTKEEVAQKRQEESYQYERENDIRKPEIFEVLYDGLSKSAILPSGYELRLVKVAEDLSKRSPYVRRRCFELKQTKYKTPITGNKNLVINMQQLYSLVAIIAKTLDLSKGELGRKKSYSTPEHIANLVKKLKEEKLTLPPVKFEEPKENFEAVFSSLEKELKKAQPTASTQKVEANKIIEVFKKFQLTLRKAVFVPAHFRSNHQEKIKKLEMLNQQIISFKTKSISSLLNMLKVDPNKASLRKLDSIILFLVTSSKPKYLPPQLVEKVHIKILDYFDKACTRIAFLLEEKTLASAKQLDALLIHLSSLSKTADKNSALQKKFIKKAAQLEEHTRKVNTTLETNLILSLHNPENKPTFYQKISSSLTCLNRFHYLKHRTEINPAEKKVCKEAIRFIHTLSGFHKNIGSGEKNNTSIILKAHDACKQSKRWYKSLPRNVQLLLTQQEYKFCFLYQAIRNCRKKIKDIPSFKQIAQNYDAVFDSQKNKIINFLENEKKTIEGEYKELFGDMDTHHFSARFWKSYYSFRSTPTQTPEKTTNRIEYENLKRAYQAALTEIPKALEVAHYSETMITVYQPAPAQGNTEFVQRLRQLVENIFTEKLRSIKAAFMEDSRTNDTTRDKVLTYYAEAQNILGELFDKLENHLGGQSNTTEFSSSTPTAKRSLAF